MPKYNISSSEQEARQDWWRRVFLSAIGMYTTCYLAKHLQQRGYKVTPQQISNWRNGQVPSDGIRLIAYLSQICRIPVSHFIPREEDELDRTYSFEGDGEDSGTTEGPTEAEEAVEEAGAPAGTDSEGAGAAAGVHGRVADGD